MAGPTLHTLKCDHCKREFSSPHYGPQTCPPCKVIGHYDGLSAYCRVCKEAA
jgi:hypothetical protein